MNRLFRLSLIVLTALGTTFPSAGLAQAVDSPTRSTPYKIAIFLFETDGPTTSVEAAISDKLTKFIQSDHLACLVIIEPLAVLGFLDTGGRTDERQAI